MTDTYNAERSVLASIIRGAQVNDPRLPEYLRRGLNKSLFDCPENREIFELINQADKEDAGSYTAATLASLSEGYGIGLSYPHFQDLLLTVPTAAYGLEHLKRLKKAVKSRELVNKFVRFNENILSAGHLEIEGMVSDFLEEINRSFEDFNPPERTSITKAVEDYLENKDKPESKVLTPIYDLNDRIGGFRDGWMVTICGRPAMGKSAFAFRCAESAALKGEVVFYSLEMQAEEFGERFFNKFGEEALLKAKELDLKIVQAAGWTIEQINSDARALKRELKRDHKKLSLIIIDHIGLLRPSNITKGRTREAEVAHASRSIKEMAQKLSCPVIALSQLNRGNEKREDRSPRLADLRESGSIEQDSDCVLGLYRESYYNESLIDSDFPDEIKILKIRQGKAGSVPARFNPEKVTWENYIPSYESII